MFCWTNLRSLSHHFMLLSASPHQNNLQEKATKAFINYGIKDDIATNYTPRGLHLTVKNPRNLSTWLTAWVIGLFFCSFFRGNLKNWLSYCSLSIWIFKIKRPFLQRVSCCYLNGNWIYHLFDCKYFNFSGLGIFIIFSSVLLMEEVIWAMTKINCKFGCWLLVTRV